MEGPARVQKNGCHAEIPMIYRRVGKDESPVKHAEYELVRISTSNH